MEEVEALKFTSSGLFWDESYRASQVLRLTQQEGTVAQLRGLLALCNTAVVDVKPKHWEVQRRLSWFISSLFMDVPRPAPVARMQSWSVLTPFYAEDLLYSAKELALKNEVTLTLTLTLTLPNPNPNPNPNSGTTWRRSTTRRSPSRTPRAGTRCAAPGSRPARGWSPVRRTHSP